MPDDGREDGLVPEGLAGGPGPTPPGFDDGTPHVEPPRAAGEDPAAPPAAQPPEEAERRGRAPRGDPEEPDPS